MEQRYKGTRFHREDVENRTWTRGVKCLPEAYDSSAAERRGKPSQAKPGQARPGQAKPSQGEAKPSQARPSQARKPRSGRATRTRGSRPACRVHCRGAQDVTAPARLPISATSRTMVPRAAGSATTTMRFSKCVNSPTASCAGGPAHALPASLCPPLLVAGNRATPTRVRSQARAALAPRASSLTAARSRRQSTGNTRCGHCRSQRRRSPLSS